MNNDLTNFIVEFSTKGLEELKQGISDLNEKIDTLGDDFKKTETSSSGFGDSLDSLTAKAIAFVAAAGSIGTVMKEISEGMAQAQRVVDESLTLQQYSASSGVASKNIEALGLALKAEGYGGDVGTAGDFFYKLSNMRKKWSLGQIPESQVLAMGDAGFTINPKADMATWIGTLADALSNAKSIDDRNFIAEAFGIGGDRNPMMLFLSEGRGFVADKMKEYGLESFLWQPEVAERANRNNKNTTLLDNDVKKMYGTPEVLDAANDITQLKRDYVNNVKSPIVQDAAEKVGGLAKLGSEVIKGATTEQTFSETVENIVKDKQTTSAVGGAVTGGLLGLGLLTAGILTGGLGWAGIAALVGLSGTMGIAGYGLGYELTEKDYEKRRAGLEDITNIPDGTTINQGSTVNVLIDPTKPSNFTVLPDGNMVTKDGRGMTIIPMGVM